MILNEEYVEILSRCLYKMQEGTEKYGDYDPETDPRDMFHESMEELIDGINYLVMAIMKINKMKETFHNECRRKGF